MGVVVFITISCPMILLVCLVPSAVDWLTGSLWVYPSSYVMCPGGLEQKRPKWWNKADMMQLKGNSNDTLQTWARRLGTHPAGTSQGRLTCPASHNNHHLIQLNLLVLRAGNAAVWLVTSHSSDHQSVRLLSNSSADTYRVLRTSGWNKYSPGDNRSSKFCALCRKDGNSKRIV